LQISEVQTSLIFPLTSDCLLFNSIFKKTSNKVNSKSNEKNSNFSTLNFTNIRHFSSQHLLYFPLIFTQTPLLLPHENFSISFDVFFHLNQINFLSVSYPQSCYNNSFHHLFTILGIVFFLRCSHDSSNYYYKI
jgi:hypothetical protein